MFPYCRTASGYGRISQFDLRRSVCRRTHRSPDAVSVFVLSVGTKRSLSFTQSGVQIPGEDSPSRLFRKLFVQGSKQEVEAQVAKLRHGRSILDSVGERARQLGSRVGGADRTKLDQFYTGVRDLEKRLHKSEQWEQQPKTKVKWTHRMITTIPAR